MRNRCSRDRVFQRLRERGSNGSSRQSQQAVRKDRKRQRAGAGSRNDGRGEENWWICWKKRAIGKNSRDLYVSHNLRSTATSNVSVLRLAWKSRGGASTEQSKKRRSGAVRCDAVWREVPRRGRDGGGDGGAGGGGDREEKEASYILYDSVIAFPRTNIALAERAQENVGVNRSSPFYSRPSVPRSFFPFFSFPFTSSPLHSTPLPTHAFLPLFFLPLFPCTISESFRNFFRRTIERRNRFVEQSRVSSSHETASSNIVDVFVAFPRRFPIRKCHHARRKRKKKEKKERENREQRQSRRPS